GFRGLRRSRLNMANRDSPRRVWLACAGACVLQASTPVLADDLEQYAQYIGINVDSRMIKGPPCLDKPPGLYIVTNPPESPAGTDAEWFAWVSRYRSMRLNYITYDGSRYGLPALQWTQSSFIQPQMMVEDRYFYDPVAGRYTVDRYLDDLEKRYGGIDSVL